MTTLGQALSEAEIERLAARLATNKNPDALSVEAVDGLFCALVAAPELILPSAYLPLILGGGRGDSRAFENLEDANETMSLLMRYGNGIAHDFEHETVHLAYILDPDADGVPGRAWARGYMRGTRFARDGWNRIFTDDGEGMMLTIPLAAGEVDPDWPKEPLTAERGDELLKNMLAAAGRAYKYFKPERGRATPQPAHPAERAAPKVGRNDPCPCGSGKKFKKCCGAPGGTIH
jgi:uncharacterized protein